MAQEITFDRRAELPQVYLKPVVSELVLPMNDLNAESGYVLYESEIITGTDDDELALENVRDYAAVYVDGNLQGRLTDGNKKILLKIAPGKHLLQLFVENIGRITYGPEILDNAKGLFGAITLDQGTIGSWKMIPLNIRNCKVGDLTFQVRSPATTPAFYKGVFKTDALKATYLDVSGWGMGEVWINNKYVGSYWEEEKQQSIAIPSDDLLASENEIVVFELKNNAQKTMKLSQIPIFK